jgi:D-glycero-alpha-D-manno-heptose-7-phosphate kinase
MITRSKAPLRLGLAGGGTDIALFSDEFGGAVLNATINLNAYCTIEDLEGSQIIFEACDFEKKEILSTEKEILDQGLRLHRGIYRRLVKDFLGGVNPAIRVSTYCDAPPGSGLGSSSTLVVAIIQAYTSHFNLALGEYDIAHLAYEIERIDLGLDGGKQDQYAAAFGGFNFMEFYKDDRVIVNPLRIRPDVVAELESRLVLFFTGVSRDSDAIIRDQIASVSKSNHNLDALKEMKDQSFAMKEMILKGNLSAFANILHEAWLVKKRTSSKISNPQIERIYDSACEHGAIAGKVSGAGGGGFMMFIVEPTRKLEVIRMLEKETGKVMSCQFSKRGATAWAAHALAA